MKFKFRLQRVLDFLQMKETAKKVEVAAAAKTLIELDLFKQKAELSLRTVLGHNGEIDLKWAPFRTSKAVLDAGEIRKLEKQLGQAKSDLEDKQFQLSQISRRRKALENLKEKRYREHRVAEGRKDQKKLDELYQLNKLRTRD